MSRRAHFGFLLPTRAVVMLSRPSGAKEVVELGVMAELGGLDGLWISDSLLARPRLEPLTILSALASRTERVTLGTAVLLAALRNPLVLAQSIATLDLLSEGRVILGVGIGTPRENVRREFDLAGVPHRERVGRLEEIVAILRGLWGDGPFTFHGRYYSFDGVELKPKPHQRGGPPIWLASGKEERALRRVGRLADGWFTNTVKAADFPYCLARIREGALEAGKDPHKIAIAWYMTLNINEKERALREGIEFLTTYFGGWPGEEIEGWGAFGPRTQIIEKIEEYLAAGVRYISLRFASPDQRGQLKRFIEEVLPSF